MGGRRRGQRGNDERRQPDGLWFLCGIVLCVDRCEGLMETHTHTRIRGWCSVDERGCLLLQTTQTKPWAHTHLSSRLAPAPGLQLVVRAAASDDGRRRIQRIVCGSSSVARFASRRRRCRFRRRRVDAAPARCLPARARVGCFACLCRCDCRDQWAPWQVGGQAPMMAMTSTGPPSLRRKGPHLSCSFTVTWAIETCRFPFLVVRGFFMAL